MVANTFIRLEKEVVEEIKKRKLIPRETYNDCLRRVLEMDKNDKPE